MKIVSFLLIGWGILMAALGIAIAFFSILTPGSAVDLSLICPMGAGVVAIYFGNSLYQKTKQTERDDQSMGS